MKTKNFVEFCKVNLSISRTENDLETQSNLAGKIKLYFVKQ